MAVPLLLQVRLPTEGNLNRNMLPCIKTCMRESPSRHQKFLFFRLECRTAVEKHSRIVYRDTFAGNHDNVCSGGEIECGRGLMVSDVFQIQTPFKYVNSGLYT